MLLRPRLLCSVILVALAGSAAALDLATFDIIDQGGGVGDMTGLRITLHDQPVGPGAQPTYQLGDYLLITPADVGTTFTINGATDTDFTTFKQVVTNGVDDPFNYFVQDIPSGSGVGTGWTENNLFAAGTRSFGPGSFTSIGQLAGPDYAGYDITAVTITIDSFDLTSGGGFNSHDFHATARIVGAAVPEASTLVLPSLAALFLLCSAWIRRRA